MLIFSDLRFLRRLTSARTGLSLRFVAFLLSHLALGENVGEPIQSEWGGTR